MPKFSQSSLDKLNTCHPDLIRLFNEVIKTNDCIVTCGHRNQADQDKAVADGFSLDPWPTSRHNKIPSLAADVCPLNNGKIDWYNLDEFRNFAKIVKSTAERLNIIIMWGGDFVHFKDYPHYQVVIRNPNVS